MHDALLFAAASYTQLGAGTSGRAATSAYTSSQAASWPHTQQQQAASQAAAWSAGAGAGGAPAAADGSTQQTAAAAQGGPAPAASSSAAQEEQFSEVFQMLNSAAGSEFGDGLGGMFNAFSE